MNERTRKEHFLANIAGKGEKIKPRTREEQYLSDIAESGGKVVLVDLNAAEIQSMFSFVQRFVTQAATDQKLSILRDDTTSFADIIADTFSAISGGNFVCLHVPAGMGYGEIWFMPSAYSDSSITFSFIGIMQGAAYSINITASATDIVIIGHATAD